MSEDLLDDIRRGDLDPIYVLHSEHPILLDRMVGEIRDVAVPPAARGFNYDVVEGKATGARIVALAQTLPMMAQRRMVYIRDLGTMPADDAEPLLAYLDKPNPSTVIVAVTSKVDKRVKLYATLSKKKFLHELTAPRQLVPWVKAEAKRLGVNMEQPAITRLLDLVGPDLSRLALTVEQLGLYAGNRAVTSDDVDELIADTHERSVFELIDAITALDHGKALALVDKMCDQREAAVGTVVVLGRRMRQLATAHALRRSNTPRNEWAQRLGVPPFLIDRIMQEARAFTPEALAIAIQRVAMADRALKGDITLIGTKFTGPQLKALGRDLGERVYLEQLVHDIVALAGA